MGTLSLAVRRMGAFFETFPVILIDQSKTVRADISFRRGSSTYGVEQLSTDLSISSGTLNGLSYSSGSLVKDYARKLNLVKYSHSTKRQLNQMVYGEHL